MRLHNLRNLIRKTLIVYSLTYSSFAFSAQHLFCKVKLIVSDANYDTTEIETSWYDLDKNVVHGGLDGNFQAIVFKLGARNYRIHQRDNSVSLDYHFDNGNSSIVNYVGSFDHPITLSTNDEIGVYRLSCKMDQSDD